MHDMYVAERSEETHLSETETQRLALDTETCFQSTEIPKPSSVSASGMDLWKELELISYHRQRQQQMQTTAN